ncbi:MAG: nicotinamide riboside transporter PnuC [Bacteroidota bacterium]
MDTQAILDFFFAPYYEYEAVDIILEAWGVIFGLLSVWYAKKENILVYPTGLISTAIFVYLLYHWGLYGDMGINAYYFSMSIYGWYNWSRPSENASILPISWASKKEHLWAGAILLASFGALYYVLTNFTDSTVPLIDSITTAIFFVGMWFMAKKKIENWLYWIVGDAISIPLYFYKGLTLSSFQYIIFLIIAIQGYFAWKNSLNTKTPVHV